MSRRRSTISVLGEEIDFNWTRFSDYWVEIVWKDDDTDDDKLFSFDQRLELVVDEDIQNRGDITTDVVERAVNSVLEEHAGDNPELYSFEFYEKTRLRKYWVNSGDD